jgi:hypothetical protein
MRLRAPGPYAATRVPRVARGAGGCYDAPSMGKPKERPKVTLPKPDEVALAKPLVEQIEKAKARLGKVVERLSKKGEVRRSDPQHRAARKRVKRAQRKLRETLKYAVARAKAPVPSSDAPATAPAAAPAAAEAPAETASES